MNKIFNVSVWLAAVNHAKLLEYEELSMKISSAKLELIEVERGFKIAELRFNEK